MSTAWVIWSKSYMLKLHPGQTVIPCMNFRCLNIKTDLLMVVFQRPGCQAALYWTWNTWSILGWRSKTTLIRGIGVTSLFLVFPHCIFPSGVGASIEIKAGPAAVADWYCECPAVLKATWLTLSSHLQTSLKACRGTCAWGGPGCWGAAGLGKGQRHVLGPVEGAPLSCSLCVHMLSIIKTDEPQMRSGQLTYSSQNEKFDDVASFLLS